MNMNNYNSNNNNKHYNTDITITKKTLLYVSIILLVSCCALGLCGGMLGANYIYNSKKDTSKSTSKVTNLNGSNSNSSVIEAATIATNSVVEISTETIKTNELMKQYISSGAGSGVILSQDGYIVTNNHVIAGASKITVTLTDKSTYEAKLVGKDSSFDIALIKIEQNNLKPAIFGNSSSLKLGEEVVAIGNPLGQLGGTITNGIISALSRDITINGDTINLLQTNALINPGNSGGGLFNSRGELIGIVVAKSSGSGVEGIGFAIPIDNIKNVINNLKENRSSDSFVQTELSLINIASSQVADMYNVNGTGVLITKVKENTNASKVGFKDNDFILSINSETIDTTSDFERIIKKHRAGDVLDVVVRRGNRQLTLKWTLSQEAN